MRKLLYILIFLLTLSFVMSCSRSVDKRLELADSLMWVNPDSSLAILEAINRDSLQGEENLAYHALLLTQAQFRCNGNCSSDTLINFALDFYSDNHNQEHYTRSLLYKGAYYEFCLKQPAKAMEFYKQAEYNADTTDTRNQAQLNMRLGVLYYNNHVGKNFDLSCFKKALYYYSILNDKHYIMLCNSYIGNIYRVTNQEKARFHLNKAKNIAKEIGDSVEYYQATNAISKSYLQDKNYKDALKYALACVEGKREEDVDYLCFYNIARAYSGLGNTDSAWYYISKTSETEEKQLLLNRYLTLKEYYNAINDNENFKKYNTLFTELADSLESNDNIRQLVNAENLSNQDFKNKKNKEILAIESKWEYLLILVFLIACIIFAILRFRNNLKITKMQETFSTQSLVANKRINEILEELDKNSKALNNKEHDLKETHNQYAAMRGLLVAHINVMKTLTIASSNEPKAIFEKTFKETVSSYRKDANLYANIKKYIDTHYGDLIEELFSANTKLNDEEKKIIELVSIGFSYIDVAVLFDRNPNAMSTRFSRISRKIGSTEPLAKHIDKLKKQKKTKNN